MLNFFLFFMVLVRRIPQSAFTVSLYAMSEHCIHSFIFVKHLRMVLFLHLNVRQKFPYTAVLKIKYICIVFSRNKLLRSDAVCGKKRIMFLILRGHHRCVSSVWLIVPSVAVVTVHLWNRTTKHLAQRIVMLLLFFLKSLK